TFGARMIPTESHRDRMCLRKALSLFTILLVASSVFGWPQQSTAPASSTSLSASERELADSIKSETIKEVVTALSADEMQGRGTAQPGGDRAAAYLSERFTKLGLKPLGSKATFLQPIKFRDFEFMP